MANGAGSTVFVSYSHDDNDWARRFKTMLQPVVVAAELAVDPGTAVFFPDGIHWVTVGSWRTLVSGPDPEHADDAQAGAHAE